MSEEERRIEKIVNQHKTFLTSINSGIMEGVLEGIKEGTTDGLKRGVKDGLKDCLTKGLTEIEQDDLGDILNDIPEAIIENSIREKAKGILEESIRDYMQRVCQDLIDKRQKDDIKLSKDRTHYILSVIKECVQGALNRTVLRLPNNPFTRELMSGIQGILEDSLEENFQEWVDKLQEEGTN